MKTLRRRLFGTNGIRGVVNETLTPKFVLRIAEAIGTFFNGGEILLGYDGRTSSPALASAVASGLAATGCTVYVAGMAPTPAIQYAVKKHGFDGGVIITASHNPPEYNGIKVLGNDGVEISRKQEIEIEEIYFEERQKRVEWSRIGEIKELLGIIDDYIEAIKSHVNIERIKKKNFQVVVDPGNGVGALAAPRLLRELGCKVFTINANIDGTFPSRPSEPKPENLTDLAAVVKAVKADFGVAYDGDADRAIFVDENGTIHWGDRSFALIEKEFLKENPGETIVTPVSSSSLVKDIAEAYNGKVVWTRVGKYFIDKDKVECPDELKEKALEMLYEELRKENLKFDTIDGAKIWFEDSSILVRPSGTEPIFRLYAEAKDRERTSELIRKYREKLTEIIKKLA